MPDLPLVVVCVATFRRPTLLAGLLQSLSQLDTRHFKIVIAVADNDDQKSAFSTVENYRRESIFPVLYFVEPTAGLAEVRNRLVEVARQNDAQWLAFVDDDQLVTSEWLIRLVDCAQATDAAAIASRWVAKYDMGVSKWVVESRYFADGHGKVSKSSIPYFGTGGVLLRLSSLQTVEGPFDTRRNLSGGEDTLLSIRLRQAGFTIAYCADAVVFERIGPDRANLNWIRRREFRNGVNLGVQAVTIELSSGSVAMRLMRAIGQCGQGLVFLMVAAVRGRKFIVKGVALASRGTGTFAGLIRRRDFYQEYRKIE